MKATDLIPKPSFIERFAHKSAQYIPEKHGCYVISNSEFVILYVGLAKNIQRRFLQHLDSPEKTRPTEFGRAAYFHWIISEDIESIERGWMNIHVANEGRLPILNKIYSPTS